MLGFEDQEWKVELDFVEVEVEDRKYGFLEVVRWWWKLWGQVLVEVE